MLSKPVRILLFGLAALALLAVGATAGTYLVLNYLIPGPRWQDTWIPQNAIVLDSAQVPGSPKAYLFHYDVGAFGYSIEMVSLGSPSYHTAVIQSDHLRRIRWQSPDSLMVELAEANYSVRPAPPRVTVVPIVTRPGP